MRRWHEERDLMLGRWREEIAHHEMPLGSVGYQWPTLPPKGDACHCYEGCGTMRKNRPYGCARGHLMCRWEKVMRYSKKQLDTRRGRQNQKREAIEFEMRAI